MRRRRCDLDGMLVALDVRFLALGFLKSGMFWRVDFTEYRPSAEAADALHCGVSSRKQL